MLVEYKNARICLYGNEILDNVNFHVDSGEFIFLTGKVGSGKSSLLKTLYAELDIEGECVQVLGYSMKALKKKHIPELRKQLGIVFQDFQLLTDRSVRKNLEFVLKATGWKKKSDIKKRITEVLEIVGLTDKLESYPHELSGGEQQRIAIARAILNNPKIIIADEPTGNLDQESGKKIVNILKDLCLKGTAIIMSTHNLDLIHQFPGVAYRCEHNRLYEVTHEYNTPIDLEETHNETNAS